MSINKLHKSILRDIKYELDDEFDLNFQRQAFFDAPWRKRKPDIRSGGALLIDSGALRRSIQSTIAGDTIRYSSDKPYANLHNEGGSIRVTEKMKRYFWWKYLSVAGSVVRNKAGATRISKANRIRSGKAEFYKAMALKKTGSKIVIPQRQFIGSHSKIDQAVESIVDQRVEEHINKSIHQLL